MHLRSKHARQCTQNKARNHTIERSGTVIRVCMRVVSNRSIPGVRTAADQSDRTIDLHI